MELNADSVGAYKQILSNPAEYDLPFKSIEELISPADTAIAKHKAHEKYQQLIDRNIPKLMFYIIMDEMFKVGKAESGDLGYLIQFNE